MGSTEQQPEKPFVVMPRFPEGELNDLMERLLNATPEEAADVFAEIFRHAGEELTPEERQVPTNQDLVALGFDPIIAGTYPTDTARQHIERTPATFEQGSQKFEEMYGRRLNIPTDTAAPISPARAFSVGELITAASLLAPALTAVTTAALVTRAVQRIRS